MEINNLILDFNGDGVVDQADVDYAATHINEATALMVNRLVNPPEPTYFYLPNGEIDEELPPFQQHWMDFTADGGINIMDWQSAQGAGIPIEVLIHIFEYISGVLPDSVKEIQRAAWKEAALSGANPNCNWYPIQEHNPQLPHSSIEADEVPPPGSNPSDTEPPVPFDEFHPLDFDMDGSVTVMDAQIAAQHYGEIVAQMVIRHWQGGLTYDINGDGLVDIVDLMSATTANVPQHILNAMQLQVLNAPPPEQEYNAEAPTAEDGSAYHPLDGNEDGLIDILDTVYWSGREDLSQIAKTLIVNMILRYIEDSSLCPYDVNGDGIVNILDVQHCATNGVPEKIVQDIAANLGSECAPPSPPEFIPPPDPGPWRSEFNLWLPNGSWGLLNGTPYFGPVHKHFNNLGRVYMTEYVHKNHSRLLIPLVANPEEALTELPQGAPVPIETPAQDLQQNNSGFSQGLTDLNGDGVVDILDQILYNQQQNNAGSSGNNTGGSGNNNNNQNNSGGGSGGGGGAY